MSDKAKIENKKITAQVKERAEQLRQKDAREMTIAEKLMIRGWEQRATIPFKSEILGEDINVVIRVPLAAEVMYMQELQVKIAQISMKKTRTTNDVKEAETAADELYNILADLCIDESLNFEFFKSGLFALDDMLKIVMEVTKQRAAQTNEAAEFRKE